MKSLSLVLLLLLSMGAVQIYTPEESKKEPAPWVSLFNGENLEGWTIRITGKNLGENYGNTFRVDSGVLKIRYNEYSNFDSQFGAIYFNNPFSNYRLRMEYRFVGETAPGAPEWGFRDSGVQFHGQAPQAMKPDQPFPVCLEYNLHGGNGTDERPTGEVCVPGTTVEVNGSANASFCTHQK